MYPGMCYKYTDFLYGYICISDIHTYLCRFLNLIVKWDYVNVYKETTVTLTFIVKSIGTYESVKSLTAFSLYKWKLLSWIFVLWAYVSLLILNNGGNFAHPALQLTFKSNTTYYLRYSYQGFCNSKCEILCMSDLII